MPAIRFIRDGIVFGAALCLTTQAPPIAHAATPFLHETVDAVGNVGLYTSLALDVSGDPCISYHDATSFDLRYAGRNGGVWTVQTVESTSGTGFYTSIALDAEGNPRISYQDNGNGDLKYASRTGSAWTTETVEAAGNVGFYTSLALDSEGNPRIGYQDATNFDLKYASKSGGTWTLETVDAAGSMGFHVSLALDSQGNPRMSHQDVTNLDLRYTSKVGGVWTAEIVDAGGSVGQYTSLKLDAQGNPCISYYDATNADLKYARKSGGTWTLETVDATGSVGTYTSLSLDALDNPRISYYDVTNTDLKYASRSTSGVWTFETVDATGNVGQHTSLALDAQGNPVISYHDVSNLDLKLTDSAIHLESPSGGELWAAGSIQTVRWTGVGSVSIQLSDNGGFSYTTLQSSISTNATTITVPATTTEQARVRISRSAPFSTSDSPGYFSIAPDLVSPWWTTIVDPTGSVGYFTSLALDAQDNSGISYQDGTNEDLRFASRSGGTWTLEIVDATGSVGNDTSLALDAQGNPRITYFDISNANLKHAGKRGGVWLLETVDASGNIGSNSSLALDAQGNSRISYLAVTGSDLKYASAAIELADPAPGVEWPVGASRTITWDGTGRVDLYLSTDGGNGWQLYESGLTGGEHRLIVPHTPSRFAALKLERAVPRSVSKTPGLFTIETSVSLLSFAAQISPAGAGADLSWASDPGPADLAGYRLERSDPVSASGFRTLVSLTRETTYRDATGAAGSHYRLFAVNGLGEELLLGEASLLPAKLLAAWPLPYRGGMLNVSFAVYGHLGTGTGQADVAVYDPAGRLVRTLAGGDFIGGQQLVTWDGLNSQGLPVGDGIYFLRALSSGQSTTLKLTVIR